MGPPEPSVSGTPSRPRRADTETRPFDSLDSAYRAFRNRHAALLVGPNPAVHPDMKPAALAFLEASPPWTSPREITEIEGYEIRREFAREVMNELNHPDDSGERPLDNNYWKMTVTMFSAIMVAPIDDLRVSRATRRMTAFDYATRLQGIRDSIQYCTYVSALSMAQSD